MKAAIVSVNVDGKDVLTEAFGDTLPDVPATTDMYFRNGAVAFAYIGNLLLQFVDEGKVSLDDTVDEWLPDLPDADKVTLLMLANQTAGYPDFEQDPAWIAAYYEDPYHSWTYEERLEYVLDRPRPFAPGDELELLAHQLHDPRRGPVEDREEAARDAAAEQGARAARLKQHHREPDVRASRRRSCTRSAPSAATTSTVPRATPFYEEETLLEHPVGDADRREPGHDDRRHDQDRDRHRRPASSSRSRATRR